MSTADSENGGTSDNTIRFYFSFRSPYAWLAAERLEAELGELAAPIERIAIFPTPEVFPNNPTNWPDKISYMVQDVRRLTREHGLSVTFPGREDPDWSLPHAAFLGARQQQDGGHCYMLELFRKRWTEGADLGKDEVIADAAKKAGMDPAAALAAAHSEELRAEVAEAWRLGAERDQIFGVPSFVFAGKLYWGQDRMHFLKNAVNRKLGMAS